MDENGNVLHVPYDNTLPFARWVAHSQVVNMRRYMFGKVFRKNLDFGQPREIHEADFDIVAPKAYKYANILEVMKVVVEVRLLFFLNTASVAELNYILGHV
jgi:translation initiation factor 2-alpha kinase 4